MLSRSEGRSFFFEGFLHPDKGVAVVQAVQVEGCFPGVVEVGLRGVHYRRVEQRLATVHHVPEDDAHGIGKGFRLRPGGSIGHPFVEKTLQGLLRPVVVFDGARVYPVLVSASCVVKSRGKRADAEFPFCGRKPAAGFLRKKTSPRKSKEGGVKMKNPPQGFVEDFSRSGRDSNPRPHA